MTPRVWSEWREVARGEDREQKLRSVALFPAAGERANEWFSGSRSAFIPNCGGGNVFRINNNKTRGGLSPIVWTPQPQKSQPRMIKDHQSRALDAKQYFMVPYAQSWFRRWLPAQSLFIFCDGGFFFLSHYVNREEIGWLQSILENEVIGYVFHQ